MGLALEGVVVYTFYNSIEIYLWMSPMSLLFPISQKKILREKRKRKLQIEFKEGISLLAASLRAGYAIENAMLTSSKELELIYGKESMVSKEFIYMGQQIRINRSIEELMRSFGERSGLDDIENFANVLAIAKRSGGELVPIIQHTVEVIRDKLQVEEEIRTLTASKQMEQKIMSAIPFLIILYLNTASPGFFDLMYDTTLGRCLMSCFLIIYCVACWISDRILRIEV